MIDDIDQLLATRLRGLREARRWSLAELAGASGVSKAMLSRIERAEVSPSATTLSRVASAFGLTLAELLTFTPEQRDRLVRAADQPEWRDPASRYVRRQVLADPDIPAELVEIAMPPGERAEFPLESYIGRRHVVWVLSGRLTITESGADWQLEAGDRLVFGEPGPVAYANNGDGPTRYLVCLVRT